MNEFPLVSVVIPTYSRPVFLKRCVDSVLNQTYSNIEVFVVDDNNPETDARQETEKTMAAYKENAIMDRIIHNTYILALDSKKSMREVMAEKTIKEIRLTDL